MNIGITGQKGINVRYAIVDNTITFQFVVSEGYPYNFTLKNAYSVDFPDVENCYTCGDSLVDAMEMASDVLAMMLCFREKEKKPIPVATPIKEIQTNADSFATLILCDTTDYPLVECEPNAE